MNFLKTTSRFATKIVVMDFVLALLIAVATVLLFDKLI
jgi:hypothetical protein